MIKTQNTTITASSSGYFNSFLQLLYSFCKKKEFQNSVLCFYDLGLSEKQTSFFKENLQKKHPWLKYRKFNFENYPEFVGLSFKTYAWKPLIIQKQLEITKGNVLWLDSANLILKPLNKIWDEINTTGAYLPISGSGNLAEWTHPSVLEQMKVSKEDFNKRNRCGGLCGFSYNDAHAKNLVADWSKSALIKEYIKPEGADRTNHRDDQSLLTILAYKAERMNSLKLSRDEVNISSGHPIDSLSVRNILPSSFPPNLYFYSTLFFKIRRKIDILINRFSR